MVDTWHSRGTPARKRRNKNWATSKTYLCYSGSERFWVWIKLFGTAKARESLQSFALICSDWILPLKSSQKLKDGSASVANQTGETPLPHGLALQIHFACLPRSSKSSLQNAKKCHTFSQLHWKNLGQILDQQFLLHLLRRGTSRCSRCICFRILSKVGWIFHPSKNGSNENGCHQPTKWSSAVSSAFLRFIPFFTSESWAGKVARRSQGDDWITRDFKHLKGGRSTNIKNPTKLESEQQDLTRYYTIEHSPMQGFWSRVVPPLARDSLWYAYDICVYLFTIYLSSVCVILVHFRLYDITNTIVDSRWL